MALPFDDASFDVVVCQFGVMFFPQRRAAYAEIARVLRPGGVFVFSTWDRIEENDFPHEVEQALARRFADDPPRFMSRTPHGYFTRAEVLTDVVAAGFDPTPNWDIVDARSRAATADIPAIAFCRGTPLSADIAVRDPAGVDAAVTAATRALANRFGPTDLDGRIRGFVVTATVSGGTRR